VTRRLPTVVIAALLLAPSVAAQQWPSFRGESASGIADGQHPPLVWNGQTGHHVAWRRPIAGLGHSSPVVWGSRLFVTTAVAPGHDPYLRPGLYGESPENPEDWVHEFRVLCLDKSTGEVLWQRVATAGKPKIPRHVKSSHATPTPATDGQRVVVSFGSEGLFAFDMDGRLLWKVDLGLLDSGAFDAPEIRWGYGSSPVIDQGRVVVLCDENNQSFLAAFDVETGRELWRTLRDEGPTWGTPTVHGGQVIVNGFHHRGGYDLATGAELWRMHGGGDIPIPTPVVADDLAFFSSAHGPERPLVAVRLEARGDVSLAEGETSNRFVAWSLPRRAAYLPTPIVYRGELYVGDDRGVLTTYRAATGEQIYQTRLGGSGGAHSSSPVAAEGNVYFTSEECETHVVEAGPSYRLVATNRVPGVCLASPALSEGTFFLRTSTELWALRGDDPKVPTGSVEDHHLLDQRRLEQAGP
jgi:outer membrane protein assembly factor BamB